MRVQFTPILMTYGVALPYFTHLVCIHALVTLTYHSFKSSM